MQKTVVECGGGGGSGGGRRGGGDAIDAKDCDRYASTISINLITRCTQGVVNAQESTLIFSKFHIGVCIHVCVSEPHILSYIQYIYIIHI